MKVLVCDDLKDRCKEVVQKIRDAGQSDLDITSLTEKDLTRELGALFEKVDACLTNSKGGKVVNKLYFDDFDLVIIDNNLSQLAIKGTRLTAESVAGYVRAFTNAPYVVSLNKNPDVDFDLRYLVGDYATRADLALNTDHLSNPALWTGRREQAKKGFLPWYWPKLNTVSEQRRAQIAFVRKHLNDSVVGALGIPEEAIDFLSLHAIGVLSPSAEWKSENLSGGKPFDEVTFRDTFVASNRSFPVKAEREELSAAAKSGDGSVLSVISRVVAADIDLWFRRDVLGPQEALVDVPHLLMRMPFLLGKAGGNLQKWNAVVEKSTPPFGIDKSLFDRNLKKQKFGHDIWVAHPSFWWPRLKADEALNELFFGSKKEDWLDAVFCEDRSEFIERSSKSINKSPTEFSAEFEGSWAHRHVARIKGSIRYAPRSRFAV